MPNDLLLYDYNQNIELSTNTSDFISFRVPYAVIGYDPSKHTRVVHIPGDTSIGRVLRSNLEMLDIIVPKSSEADNTELADGFSALLQTFITRDLIDVRLRERYAASREAAVRRYIKTNLTKNDLGAAAICDAVGVSRAVLYRLFEAEGGVQKAILNMRLTSAFQELTQTEEEWGAIGRIAGKWGFPDQAHFSRRFREVFGIRPSDAIGSSKQVAGLQEATDYKVHSRASKSALLMKLYGASQGRGVLLGGEFGLGTCYKSLA
jgi:AraC-like DNA-binding protein